MNKIPWEDINIVPRDEWNELCLSGGQTESIRSMQLCLFGSLAALSYPELAALSFPEIVAEWFKKDKS
jgi:hypothetical protein